MELTIFLLFSCPLYRQKSFVRNLPFCSSLLMKRIFYSNLHFSALNKTFSLNYILCPKVQFSCVVYLSSISRKTFFSYSNFRRSNLQFLIFVPIYTPSCSFPQDSFSGNCIIQFSKPYIIADVTSVWRLILHEIKSFSLYPIIEESYRSSITLTSKAKLLVVMN